MSVTVSVVDYRDPGQTADLVRLLDIYARGETGGGRPLDDDVRRRLPLVLDETPGAFSLMTFEGDRAVGLANCFMGLSTFACRPLVNIHDLMVVPECRGQGIGKQLLTAVEAIANDRGCCKVTLEVLQGNHAAVSLYKKFGFRTYELAPEMGKAMFMQKPID